MNKYIKKSSLNSLHYPKVSKVDFYSLDFLFRSLALFSLLFLPFIFVFFLSFPFASTNSIHFSRFIDSITRSVALKVLLSIWQKDVHFSDSFNVCGFSRRSFSTLDMYRFMLSHSLVSSCILVRSCFASSLLLHFLRMRPLLRWTAVDSFQSPFTYDVFNRHSNISQLSLSPIFICFNLHSLRALSLSISLRLCRIGLFLRWSGDIFSHINVWTTPQILQIIYRSETKRGSFTLWPNNVSVNIRCKIINWIIKTGKLSLEIEMVRHYLIRCGEVRWVRKMNGKCLVLLRMWYLRCLVWDWIVVLICVGAEWLR